MNIPIRSIDIGLQSFMQWLHVTPDKKKTLELIKARSIFSNKNNLFRKKASGFEVNREMYINSIKRSQERLTKLGEKSKRISTDFVTSRRH